jgi:hypothetical protein
MIGGTWSSISGAGKMQINGIAVAPLVVASTALAQSDPLPSWNDGAAQKAILDFVARTTASGMLVLAHAERAARNADHAGRAGFGYCSLADHLQPRLSRTKGHVQALDAG